VRRFFTSSRLPSVLKVIESFDRICKIQNKIYMSILINHVNPVKGFIPFASADRERTAIHHRESSTRRVSTPSSRPGRSVATERLQCFEFHPPPDCPTKQAAPAHQSRETKETPPS